MPSHDRQKLRRFIQDSFSDEELGNFCFDYFPQIYNEFTTGMPKSQKVRMLVTHAESGSRLRDLYAALKRENPRAYGKTFPEGDAPAQPLFPQPTTRNPHQIFISYASADVDFAHQLAADLRAQNWQTWIAPESIRPGEKWVEAINRGLAESGVLVLVLSAAAVDSSYVRDETNFAIELMRHGEAVRVIPVELEPVPPAKIPFTWASLQRIDIRSDYQVGLTALLEELAPEPEDQMLPPDPVKPVKEQTVSRVTLETEETPELIWNRAWQWLRNLPLSVWFGGVAVLFVVLLAIFWPDSWVPTDETPTRVVTSEPGGVSQTADAGSQTVMIDSGVPPATAELGDTWTRSKDGMVMVYVPPPDAPFVLESGVAAPTEGLWIDKYEVSNAQYQLCVDAGVCEPAGFMDDDNYNGTYFPVVGVSAYDAETYSSWVGGVLPSEGQWEYAATGNSGYDYPWGEQFDGARLNCRDCDDPYPFTAPVASFSDDRSWVGTLNVAGNVWEWTASWWKEENEQRIIRGGSWIDSSEDIRISSRGYPTPDYRGATVGFRVVVPVFLPVLTETLTLPLATEVPMITPTANLVADSNGPPVDAALGDTWMRPTDGMVMVYVPPPDASFVLGSGMDAPTDGYWIDKYEVSNAQYELCVKDEACEPSEYVDNAWFIGDNDPVVGISWFDAEKYSLWVRGMLPTEAEWEYAAVGGNGAEWKYATVGSNSADYPWGDEFDGTLLNFCDASCDVSIDWDDNYQFTAPVDSYPNGKSWVGALNLVGNVWEWTASWWNESETERVLRGGSWANVSNFARAAYRYNDDPGVRRTDVGFRVVVRTSSSQ